MNRDELETMAKEKVCSCWYYDLADTIDTVDSDVLYRIIKTPYYCHLEQAMHTDLPINELVEELKECSEYK